MFHCPGNGRATIMHIQLLINIAQMTLNRTGSNDQSPGNLLVRQAFSYRFRISNSRCVKLSANA